LIERCSHAVSEGSPSLVLDIRKLKNCIPKQEDIQAAQNYTSEESGLIKSLLLVAEGKFPDFKNGYFPI